MLKITLSFFSDTPQSPSRTARQSRPPSAQKSPGTDSYSSNWPSAAPAPWSPSSPPPNPSCSRLDLHTPILTQQHALGPHLLLQLSQPVVNPLETLRVSQIKHQQRDLRVSVVERHDRSESLITRSVPNIQLNLFSILSFDLFLLISTGKCRLMQFFENSILISHRY